MADTDFYKTEDNTQTETKTDEQSSEDATKSETPTFKVGESEYTQDELNVLVEKGKLAKEIEEKQNIKIDKVWPGHQELSNKVRDYEKQIEELKQAKTATKVESGVELTEAEQIAQAKTEAKRLGIVTVDDVDSFIKNIWGSDYKLIKDDPDTRQGVSEMVQAYLGSKGLSLVSMLSPSYYLNFEIQTQKYL